MGISSARSRQVPARIRMFQVVLLILVSIISYGALVLPQILLPTAVPLKPGDVSPSDFQAPRSLQYISEVRTEEARKAAESAVVPVYAPPEPSIARGQIERLRAALQYITLVRNDENSTPQQKASDIASLKDIALKPQTIESILALPPARWDAIQQESLSVLEQVMRRTIHEQDVESVRRTIPSLVSLALNEEQAMLVAELVTAFVVPNSVYSEDLTKAAKQSARDTVQPVIQEYKAGEIIVLRGQIIGPAEFEALQQFGLIEEASPWLDYAGAGALIVMIAAFVNLYFSRRRLPFLFVARSLVLVALIFILFIVSARLTIPNRTVLPYAFPLAALGLLIATLFGVETGIVFSIALAILVPYNLPNAFDLTPYYLLSSLTGVLVLGNARRVWTFFRAGMATAGAGIAMLIAFRFPYVQMDIIALLQLTGAAIFSGLAASSIALLLQYFLAQALGLTTALQLIEISRPDFPLLQFFLRNAPGTYQHSLQVANLAEQAAEAIGADALLTRVGALFHDVGKSMNPMFFVENQPQDQVNTHEDLAPIESAEAIISHVNDGIVLAHKHRLPRRIDDFILEHHGTMLTRYQYNQAVEAAGGDASTVDKEQFRYPGPSPRSRETALLMIADGSEARARAERPEDEEAIRNIVRSTIEVAQKQGQLDNTQLTLRDLSVITDVFVSILRGTHHPRISYPKESPATQDVSTVPNKK
ncbi:MAG TPA: HDIG domain-containing protein [Anaerolineales bacterium]|nr:HDIG domain-containing protein [Anaerolineales bacterium]HLO34287.1 HDIG domain-containing protein [Anaerolineales bacterium]